MRLETAFSLLCLAASLTESRAAEGPRPGMSVCLEGNRTRLMAGSNRPVQTRHDETVAGETVFEVVPRSGAETSARYRLPLSLDCIGFNPAKGFYVLSGTWEAGAVSAVRGLWYWPESAKKPVESEFQASGQDALVRLWSADFRYLVFINTAGELGVLNTETDRITLLGAAPLPPPMGEDAADMLDSGRYSAFDWEFYAEQGAGPLETGILTLEGGHVLKASFGEDTVKARAKERRVRTWDLDRVLDASASPAGSWSAIASRQRRPCPPKVDGRYVYWGTSDGRILRASKTARTAQPTTLARVSGAVRAVDLDEGSLYAVVSSAGGDAVVRIPMSGGAARVLARRLASSDPSLVTDGEAVYWGTGGALWRAPLKDARGVKIVESPEYFPTRLAYEGGWIYWSNSSDDNAGVWRAPKLGGAATQVAGTGFDEVSSFVVAPPWLFYVVRGSVLRRRLEPAEDEKPVKVADGLEIKRWGAALLVAAPSGALSSLDLESASLTPVSDERGDLDPSTLVADPAGLFVATAPDSSEDGFASILRLKP